MLVYRVEHYEKNFGPYATSRMPCSHWPLAYELCDKHNGSRNHPVAEWIGIDEFCGFSSLQQMKNWFNGFIKKLHKYNYRISVYDCPDDKVKKYDDKQIVFVRSKAKLIKRMSMFCRKP